MMYYSIYVHRPRTQRIGENSRARELFIQEVDNETIATKLEAEMNTQLTAMISAGYPWPGGIVSLLGGKTFQLQPNDKIYIKCSVEKTDEKYISPRQETVDELIDITLARGKI